MSDVRFKKLREKCPWNEGGYCRVLLFDMGRGAYGREHEHLMYNLSDCEIENCAVYFWFLKLLLIED